MLELKPKISEFIGSEVLTPIAEIERLMRFARDGFPTQGSNPDIRSQ